ncbi:N-acetylmuramoyl-L-alanine amidase [Niallia circulans]|uniref:N-acetylmuramoyl-L-alanine amidase n=1 Tax=Niallia circulans TaxID=1397 RepID=UPI0026EAC82D|nr:N-acetylmuramoyl-L-alanine amidase [Niallia circulans]
MVKIFIDPGHGGSDSGAIGNGLQEKNITLSIAQQIRKFLLNEYEDVEIRMSRNNDSAVSLSARVNAANNWNADFYLSIHVNAGGGNGFESYIYPGVGAPTTTYQNDIHKEVIDETGFNDRGKKNANFHVLRETTMPALLTENGFIDTVADVNQLKDSNFITKIAKGHVQGLERAFSLQKKKNQSPIYRVQIGAYKEKENAEKKAMEAAEKGFDTAILFRNNLFKVQIGAFSNRKNAERLADRAKEAGFHAFISRK